jgi:hypothetical protein
MNGSVGKRPPGRSRAPSHSSHSAADSGLRERRSGIFRPADWHVLAQVAALAVRPEWAPHVVRTQRDPWSSG